MPRVASPVFACFPSLSLPFCLHLAPGLRERLKRAASSLKITSRGILRRYLVTFPASRHIARLMQSPLTHFGIPDTHKGASLRVFWKRLDRSSSLPFTG